MSEKIITVLVVDDEPNILRTIGMAFDAMGYDTTLCSKPQDALDTLHRKHYDLAFVDYKMSPIDGMEVLEYIKKHSSETTVTMITAHGSIDSAVEAMKRGAYHYLQKPFDLKELQLFAQRAQEYHMLSREVTELRTKLAEHIDEYGEIITQNRDMLKQLSLASRVAESDLSVLIEGESGTGKEMIAGFIHNKSTKANAPFVRVNCAALPEQLLESELFGHVKGAFTGALKDRAGRFETANGGTIFLDEIAEVPLSVQVKLLRVVQQKEYERVGEDVTRKAGVRIIAASNRNLDEALKEGTFREDLFYRLSGVRIKLPPLRERMDDIALLAKFFLQKYSPDVELTIAPDALKALKEYRWYGNVRELEHVIERAVVLAKSATITLHEFPDEFIAAIKKPQALLSLEEMEKEHIRRVLQTAHDYEEAARLLGIDPATLWRKRKKYGM
jgi:NtrC-family two-component system response regulator AlgB